MRCTRLTSALVGLSLCFAAGGAITETFDNAEGEPGFFNSFFNHELTTTGGQWFFFDDGGGDWDLWLRAASDQITFNTDPGFVVVGASVDMVELEGGFAGTSTLVVRFHGRDDSIGLSPGFSGLPATLSADNQTIGDNGLPLGPIERIALHAQRARFDDVTVAIAPDTTCIADRNHDDTVDISDVLSYLTDWFAGDADLDGSGQTDSVDLLIFLDAWFRGC